MLIYFKLFSHYPELTHGISTKSLGSLDEKDPDFQINLQKFQQQLNIRSNPHLLNQVHGTTIEIITEPTPKTILPQADAIITALPDIPLMIKIADCQAIFLYDPTQKVIAAIHGGWRSLAKEILPKVIRKMKEQFQVNSKNILAGISPSLGPCCAEFSDPKNELPASFHRFVDSKNHVDFWNFTQEQLKSFGLRSENIEITGICSQCSEKEYYSHRRKETGRMGAMMMLKDPLYEL